MAGVGLSRARLSVRLSEPLHGDGGGHDQAVSVHGQRPGAPAHGDRGDARSVWAKFRLLLYVGLQRGGKFSVNFRKLSKNPGKFPKIPESFQNSW